MSPTDYAHTYHSNCSDSQITPGTSTLTQYKSNPWLPISLLDPDIATSTDVLSHYAS